jgi:hypothetical protein
VWLESLDPLNAKFNPICHLLALIGAHPIFHVSRIRVNTGDDGLGKKNVYLPSLRMKVPDHAYVFGSLLLQ